MKITKTQSLANRAHIVETASELFRERGYDGVGIAELMAASGLTQGGFYKHFGSKADLMAEAAEHSLQKSLNGAAGLDIPTLFQLYVSKNHRNGRRDGCTMAALCGDASRHSDELKSIFAGGIENTLSALEQRHKKSQDPHRQDARAEVISLLAQAVGAIILSRACPDESPLADEVLEVCRAQILASCSPSGEHTSV